MPVPNFRDYGGYASRHGGTVVRDRLYRSGGFAAADKATIAKLAEYDFELIVDLRYVLEQQTERSPWPEHLARRVMAHGSNRETVAPHLMVLQAQATDPAMVDHHFTDYYRQLPYEPKYRPMFARVLRALAEVKGRSVVHCSAGKDRTGMVVMLMHHVLGVAPDVIMDDFLQSANAPGFSDQAEKYQPRVSQEYGYEVPIPVLERLLSVQPEWLETALSVIDGTSGSLDRYLDDMGVDETVRDRIRDNYLVR